MTLPTKCKYPEECKHFGRCIRVDDHDRPPPCLDRQTELFLERVALKLEPSTEVLTPEVVNARIAGAMQQVMDDDTQFLNRFFRMPPADQQELAGMISERVYEQLKGGSQL